MEWHYSKNALRCGPVDAETLSRMIQSEELAAGDLVWRDPWSEWRALGDVEEFSWISLSKGSGPIPATTPTVLFFWLEGLGLDPGKRAAARMTGSLRAGFESLIKFQGEKGRHLSLASHEDLADYVGLVSGREVHPSVQGRFGRLQELSGEGDRFYLKRGKRYLETDVAGAAVVIGRGDPIVRLRQAGEPETWTAVPELPGRPHSERVRIARILDRAEQLGFELSLLSPDPVKKPKSIDLLKECLREVFSKKTDIESRCLFIGEVEKGKRLLARLPGRTEIATSPEHLGELLRYIETPEARHEAFKTAFEALREDSAVVMRRSNAGYDKGALLPTCDQGAYLQLLVGGEVVVLTKDGLQHRLTHAGHFEELRDRGRIEASRGLAPDPEDAGHNLFIVYAVAPFDPTSGGGSYDDLLLRLSGLNSPSRLDIVAMHSDLPKKRNLRVDRVGTNELENLQKLDADTPMNDPELLERFLAETLAGRRDESRIRFLVSGHGGAEAGLLPDGKVDESSEKHLMGVDAFAEAIHRALDRVEAETGKRPFIDNLILSSCLMGNTSLIHALSEAGDVGVLSASPEVMFGCFPGEAVQFLHDPERSRSSGEAFAKFLVDTIPDSPAAPGGSKAFRHAETFGAYRLDKSLARDFQKSLEQFFEACLRHPEQAGAVKRAIAACPTYGINPLLSVLFDIDNRDVIQVAERIVGDARVRSAEIKEACRRLVKATEALVVAQKAGSGYEGRRGPTLYLPIDRFDFEESMAETQFLKGTDYRRFLEMIFDAPLRRGVWNGILAEVTREIENETKTKDDEKPSKPDDSTTAAATEELPKTDQTAPSESANGNEEESLEAICDQLEAALSGELEQVHNLEILRSDGWGRRLGRGVRFVLESIIELGAAAAGAVIAAVPGALCGAVFGLRAGIRGYSLAAHRYGSEEGASATTGVGQTVKLAFQACLYPSEAVGLAVNEWVGYRAGSAAAAVAGGAVGAVGGAIAAVAAAAAAGFAVGALVGVGVGKLVCLPLPKMPKKDHGSDESAE